MALSLRGHLKALSLIVAISITAYCENSTDHNMNVTQSCEVSEAELFEHLLKNYSSQARPTLKANRPIVVQIGLRLFGIRDFIEQRNTLIIDGYLTMNWYDELIKWNTLPKYSCVDLLFFDATSVWSPNLKLMTCETAGGTNIPIANEKILAAKNGSMYFYALGEFDVRCELNVRLFPFDQQRCKFVVESWNYPKTMQTIEIMDPPFAKIAHFWTENDLWKIVGNSTSLINHVYINDDGVYNRAIFTLDIQRKPLFYYVHVIVPNLIITAAELITFLLPVGEFMKVHISFTCLLAYSVFENMIITDLPKSSKQIPLLSLYIDLQMAYIGVIALLGEGLVCIALRQADFQNTRPPSCIFKAIDFTGRIIFYSFPEFVSSASTKEMLRWARQRRRTKRPQLMNGNAIDSGSNHQKYDINGSVNRGEVPLPRPEMWIYMAEVISRINMWLYIAAISITPAVLFSYMQAEMPNSDTSEDNND